MRRMALNGLYCADVPLSTILDHSLKCVEYDDEEECIRRSQYISV